MILFAASKLDTQTEYMIEEIKNGGSLPRIQITETSFGGSYCDSQVEFMPSNRIYDAFVMISLLLGLHISY